jgi:alcohol dehydrogenase
VKFRVIPGIEVIFFEEMSLVKPFELINQTAAKVIFGAGTADLAGDLIKKLGCSKVMLVTDKGLSQIGIPEIFKAKLEEEGLSLVIYDEIASEPKETEIDLAVQRFRRDNFDAVVGLGGGSALDSAKVIAVLGNERRTLAEIYGTHKIFERKIHLILIPTTAGTGSEATPNALFLDPENNKNPVISPYLLPDVAILDPKLTMGLPDNITAFTGMDALAHCLESWVSTSGNVISEAYAYQGLRLIAESIGTAVINGKDMDARGKMLLGSHLGGMALTIAGTTAVHALSYPLGKRGVPHGIANGLLLPRVFQFNLPSCIEPLATLAPILGLAGSDHLELAAKVIKVLDDLLKQFPVPKTLGELNIDSSEIPAMAAEALLNERLLQNNPVPILQTDAEKIYYDCLTIK